MYIKSKPVLYMVDLTTHFCGAQFLRLHSEDEVWRTIQYMWSLVSLVPPGTISIEQRTKFVSKEMHGNCQASGVKLKETPLESTGSIGTVERYHAPLRTAFEIIRMEMGREVSYVQCLKMEVFATNRNVGPEGLCPMPSLFGKFSYPAR